MPKNLVLQHSEKRCGYVICVQLRNKEMQNISLKETRKSSWKKLTSPNLSTFCILDKFPPIDISSKLERILLILPSLDGLFFSLDRKMSPWTHNDACFL